MWRLLVPLKYLRISHPEKIKFDLVFPFVFACLFFLPVFSSAFRADALKGIDVLGRSSDLMSILTGFFVASLAAVATFGGEEMNELMPGKKPVLLPQSVGPPEHLTRRRFLCFLFGYLAFTSLAVYLFGFAYFTVQTYVLTPLWPDYRIYFFVLFWWIYGFGLGNLLANTLLGLFYLTDRMHRPNRAVRWNAKQTDTSTKDSSKVA